MDDKSKINGLKKRVHSKDPLKKWCSACKKFLDRKNDFYFKGGYCRACCKNKSRIQKYDLTKRLKYQCKCSNCNKNFLSAKRNQNYCGSKCGGVAGYRKRRIQVYSSLPNELRDQILQEEGIL